MKVALVITVQLVLGWFDVLHFASVPSTFSEAHCPEQCHCLPQCLVCCDITEKKLKFKHIPVIRNEKYTFMELDFAENYISSIDKHVWLAYPWTKSLILQHNLLHELKSDDLDGLPLLRHLDLSRNRIEKIDENVFEPVPLLESANVAYNNITHLHPQAFQSWHGLQFLTSLNLSHNPLLTITPGDIPMMPSLRYLDLRGTSLTIEMIVRLLSAAPALEILFLPASATCCMCHLAKPSKLLYQPIYAHCEEICVRVQDLCAANDTILLRKGMMMKELREVAENKYIMVKLRPKDSLHRSAYHLDILDYPLKSHADTGDDNDGVGEIYRSSAVLKEHSNNHVNEAVNMLVGMNELISEQVPMKTAKHKNSKEYDLTEEELEKGTFSGSKDAGIAEPQAKSSHDIGDHKQGFEKHHRLSQFEKQHEENHPSRKKGNVKRKYMTHSKHTQTTVEAVQHTSKKINKETGTKPDSAEKSQNLDKHLRNNNNKEIHLVKAHENKGGSKSTDVAKQLIKTENEIKLSKRSIEMPGQSKGHQRGHMMEHEVKPDDEQKAGNPEDNTDKRKASDALATEGKISDIATLLKQDLKEHQSESSEAAATDGSKSSVALKHPARLIKPVPLIKLSRDVASMLNPSHVHIVDQAEPAIMKMDISHDSDTAEKIQHSETTSSVAPTDGFNQVERMSSPEEQTADVSLKGDSMQTKKPTLESVKQQLLHTNHESVKEKSDREGLGNETEEEEVEEEEEEEEEETPAKIKITETEEIPPQASDILPDLQNGGSGQDSSQAVEPSSAPRESDEGNIALAEHFESVLNQQLVNILPIKAVHTLFLHVMRILKVDCLQPRVKAACSELISESGLLLKILKHLEDTQGIPSLEAHDQNQIKPEQDSRQSSTALSHKKTGTVRGGGEGGESSKESKKVPFYENKLVLAVSGITVVMVIIVVVFLIEIRSRRSARENTKFKAQDSEVLLKQKFLQSHHQVPAHPALHADLPKPLWLEELYKPLDSVRRKTLAQPKDDQDSSDEEEIFNRADVRMPKSKELVPSTSSESGSDSEADQNMQNE